MTDDAALTSLAELVSIVRRTGGYMTPEDQFALRAAEQRLRAAGIAVAETPRRSTR